MEQTLFILKPDATIRRHVGALTLDILVRHFKPVAFKEVRVPHDFSEVHYAEHRGKFFYNWLVNFLTIYNVVVVIFEGENVIKETRELLGNTLAHKADPDTIRGKFGIWGGVNIAHASDSADSAKREIKLWKNNFDLIFDERTASDDLGMYLKKWLSKNPPKTKTYEMREICKKYCNDDIERKDAILSLEKIIISELRENNIPYEKEVIRNFVDFVLANVDFSKTSK